ncbi:MAG: hypothetical protein P8X70_00515 [Nanoarchaeota archaeon]
MPEEKQKSWFRRHWILSILLGFIALGIIGGLLPDSESDLTGDTINSQNQNTKQNLAKFESEVGQVGTSLTQYRVINRNNYDWHNVKITVNDYYSCWDRDILESEDSILINAVGCDQFVVNQNIIQSIWIEADEGAERYSLN